MQEQVTTASPDDRLPIVERIMQNVTELSSAFTYVEQPPCTCGDDEWCESCDDEYEPHLSNGEVLMHVEEQEMYYIGSGNFSKVFIHSPTGLVFKLGGLQNGRDSCADYLANVYHRDAAVPHTPEVYGFEETDAGVYGAVMPQYEHDATTEQILYFTLLRGCIQALHRALPSLDWAGWLEDEYNEAVDLIEEHGLTIDDVFLRAAEFLSVLPKHPRFDMHGRNWMTCGPAFDDIILTDPIY